MSVSTVQGGDLTLRDLTITGNLNTTGGTVVRGELLVDGPIVTESGELPPRGSILIQYNSGGAVGQIVTNDNDPGASSTFMTTAAGSLTLESSATPYPGSARDYGALVAHSTVIEPLVSQAIPNGHLGAVTYNAAAGALPPGLALVDSVAAGLGAGSVTALLSQAARVFYTPFLGDIGVALGGGWCPPPTQSTYISAPHTSVNPAVGQLTFGNTRICWGVSTPSSGSNAKLNFAATFARCPALICAPYRTDTIVVMTGINTATSEGQSPFTFLDIVISTLTGTVPSEPNQLFCYVAIGPAA